MNHPVSLQALMALMLGSRHVTTISLTKRGVFIRVLGCVFISMVRFTVDVVPDSALGFEVPDPQACNQVVCTLALERFCRGDAAAHEALKMATMKPTKPRFPQGSVQTPGT